MLLDGRQFRSDQTCGDVVLSVDPACPETADPTRTMLGTEQEQWLGEQLAATTATWPVIAQQTVLSNVTLPNGAVLNYDQWDGYPAARQRLLLQAAQAARTIVLTGDIHLAAVGTLPGVGVEFVTSSISSPGLVPPDVIDVLTGFPDIVDAELVPPRLHPPHRHATRLGPPSTAPSTTSPIRGRRCRRGRRSLSTSTCATSSPEVCASI